MVVAVVEWLRWLGGVGFHDEGFLLVVLAFGVEVSSSGVCLLTLARIFIVGLRRLWWFATLVVLGDSVAVDHEARVSNIRLDLCCCGMCLKDWLSRAHKYGGVLCSVFSGSTIGV